MDTVIRVQIPDGVDYVSWKKYETNYSPSSYGQIVGQTEHFNFGMETNLGEGKLRIQTS